MKGMRDLGMLIGRILLAVIFVNSGLSKLMHPAMVAGFMTAKMPAALVYPLLYMSAAIELGGAVLLIIGLLTGPAALILFLWMIPVTIIFHVITHQTIEWIKNLSIMGGLLILASGGPGSLSVSGRKT